MFKKTKASRSQCLTLIAAIAAIAAGFMIFAPALSLNDTAYTGTNVTFGKKINDLLGIAGRELRFNFLAMLAYTLPIAAAAVLVVSKGKLGALVAAILTLASVMLLKTLPDYVNITLTLGNNESTQSVDWQVQWGWIAAICLAAVSTLISLYQAMESFIKR